MTQLTQKSRPNRFSLQTVRDNPITLKELRSRMRGRRAFIVLTVYLLLMSLFITLVYAAFATSSSQIYGPSLREGGYSIFVCMLVLQSFVAVFVGPSFTSSSITGEKERQTYDLLRTTLLSPKKFVLGKLISALSYVFLLLLTAVPLQGIAFLLGGITLNEFLLSQIIIFVAAITFAIWGLYCSSRMGSTLSASVTTYAGTLFVTAAAPIIGFFLLLIASPLLNSYNLSSTFETIMAFGGILLAALNFPATLIGSIVILIQNNSWFFYQFTNGGYTYYAPSPWMLFVIVYLFISWILYRSCVKEVSKIAN